MKKIMALLVVSLFLLPINTLSISAETSNTFTNEDSNNVDLYQKYVAPVFVGDTSYKVISSEGEDYTENFIENNKMSYMSNDRVTVKNYLYENNLIIQKDNYSNNRFITNRYNKEFYAQVTGYGKNGFTGANDSYHGEISYAITGSATCDNKGIVTSYSKPSVSATSGINGWYPVYVGTSATSNGGYITVNFSFQARWSVSIMNVFTTQFTTRDYMSGKFNFSPQF